VAKKEQYIINDRPRETFASGRPRGAQGWVILLATLALTASAVAVDEPVPVTSDPSITTNSTTGTTPTAPTPTDPALTTPTDGTTPAPATVAVETTAILRTLRAGSRGEDVRDLQRALRKRGLRITVDGAFGPQTRRAVKAMQRRFKVPPTGVAQPSFQRRLGILIRTIRSGPAQTVPVDPGSYPLAGPNAAQARYLKAFPVAGKHTYFNDFGAPRSQGSHQGNDIMADRGVPLRAVADGTIRRLTRTQTGLGGLWIWLRDTAGNDYYYAHMDTVAADLVEGSPVKVGQVVGTVGNTGDARYGAPHLHFEIHPGGGSATNPYSDLLAVDPERPRR
jgi:murein DD-endopeptidase MepM/ murein hydrolase activator NlpD